MKKRNKALVAALTSLAVFLTGPFVHNVEAALAPVHPTTEAMGSFEGRDLSQVKVALQSKALKQRLIDFGIPEQKVNERLNNLTEQDLQMISERLDAEDPGGDAAGVVLTIILVGILVWLFLHLVHHDPHI